MPEEKKLSTKVEKIAKEIEGLTALELSELASYLEKKFGVSGMPMMGTITAGTAPASAEATAGKAGKEEKTIFTVNLTDAGANKLAVIKVVRELLPNLGLMEAKKLVESAPRELLKDIKKEAAEEAKKKIEAAGGKVELK